MSTIANPGDMLAVPQPADTQRILPAPAQLEAGGMGAAEVWRIIKQHRFTIITAFLIFYFLVGVATVVVYKFFPAYTAEGWVELDPPRDETYQIDPKLVDPDMMKLQLESEARKLKSLSILTTVLKLPEIKQTQFYRWYQEDFQECLYEFESMVASTAVPDTSLIRVRLSCQAPEEAKLIVDTLLKQYQAYYRDQSLRHYSNQNKTLGDLKTKLESELQDLQKRMTTFRETRNIPQLESQRSVVADALASLSNEITLYEAHLAQLEGNLDSVRRMGSQMPVTPEMKIIVESDPILRFWRQQSESLAIEMSAMLDNVIGPSHRQYRVYQNRYRGYTEAESGKREELISDLRDRELQNLDQSVASTQRVLARLRENYQEKLAEQRDLDKSIQEFLDMDDTRTRLLEELTEIDGKVREAEFALKDDSRVRLRIAQYPELPHKPSRPNLPLFLGGGFILSVLASVGLAFLREFTDTAVRTPHDVSRHARISVLGCIPLLDDDTETEIEQIETAVRTAPQSLVAEAFRQVRTALLFSGPVEAQRSLLLTSPSPGDGKSAVAINLAVSLARSNQRVLLIDANFRRPSVRDAFGQTRTEGLSNVLVGQMTLDQVVCRTDMPNLDVLCSGPLPPTPAELLGTRYMRELLTETVKRYDRVIIDGPPVLLVSDALVLATMVDGTILVTRAVSNSKGALRRAREQLAKVGARVLGGILNSAQTRSGGYFKRQYRDFYDYVAEEAPPRELPEGEQKGTETPPSA
ncbi:MAG: hypothetical protein CHACPFDD_00517 [Phycisphaerae bacterium]|nr:hypothetical protein [Phycisphaerae bacterium]